MTTIGEILYSDGNSISVFEKKLLLSHVLGFSNEKLNLTHSKKIGDKDLKNFEQLINYLKEKNLEILDISIDEGDLEDVFIQLTKN